MGQKRIRKDAACLIKLSVFPLLTYHVALWYWGKLQSNVFRKISTNGYLKRKRALKKLNRTFQDKNSKSDLQERCWKNVLTNYVHIRSLLCFKECFVPDTKAHLMGKKSQMCTYVLTPKHFGGSITILQFYGFLGIKQDRAKPQCIGPSYGIVDVVQVSVPPH